MTEENAIDPSVEDDESDEFQEVPVAALAAYLDERGIANRVEKPNGETGGSVSFSLPAGREVREVTVLYFVAKAVREADVAKWRFSDKYNAIFNTETGETEVLVTAPRVQGKVVPIWDLPGAVKGPEFSTHKDEPIDSRRYSKVVSSWLRIFDIEVDWSLSVENQDCSLELAPESDLLFGLGHFLQDSPLSIRVRHREGATGPSADALIDGPVRDFLTELDFTHGVSIEVVELGGRIASVPVDLEGPPVAFPRNRYDDEPKTLYWYGNGANELPLVQFLAYYQVLEFYFPQFNREAVIHRLRTKLKDPSFDISDSAHLDRLISATAEAHYGIRNELDQLRATLRTCVDDDDLRAYIEAEDQKDHFTRSKQSMKGVQRVNLKQDLHEQLATRIYQIRNRIVHTKDLDEGSGLELLLPTSDETRTMGPEIMLVRWLAQRAMIHGSKPYAT